MFCSFSCFFVSFVSFCYRFCLCRGLGDHRFFDRFCFQAPHPLKRPWKGSGPSTNRFHRFCIAFTYFAFSSTLNLKIHCLLTIFVTLGVWGLGKEGALLPPGMDGPWTDGGRFWGGEDPPFQKIRGIGGAEGPPPKKRTNGLNNTLLVCSWCKHLLIWTLG